MLTEVGMAKGRAPGWVSLGIAHGLGLGGEMGRLAVGHCPMGKASGASTVSGHREKKINQAGLRNLLGMTDEHFS